MRTQVRPCLVCAMLVITSGWLPAARGQERVERGSPPPHVRERIGAIERLVEGRTEESIRKFLEEQLTPELRASKSDEAWIAALKEIRRSYQGFGTVQVRPAGSERIVSFGECPGEDTPLHIEIDSSPPHLLKQLRLGDPQKKPAGNDPATANTERQKPLTWDNVKDRLKEEEAGGFSGSVLIAKDGEIFLHEGYGLCNREKNIRCKPESIFAVGSVPIDFTKAAVLKLTEMGKITLSNSIADYLPNVPEDKKAITVEHLMNGRSGLRNFHERPTDANLDHTWIDRDTAVKRILEDDLLFKPGTDKAHSHSAFGLLAAMVEIVSGESYGDFVQKYLFSRGEMTRTALYEDAKFPEEDVAIGYGGVSYGAVNSPLHWGKTSWLVLGSGGMVSTTGDLYRWVQGIRAGKILTPHTAPLYWSPPGSVLSGASENGFTASYTEGPGSMMVLLSNSGVNNPRTEQLVRDLAKLVITPKYRLGITIAFSPDAVTIQNVQDGTPAHEAGLRSGDEIVAVNGEPVDAETGKDRLLKLIEKGESLELRLKRGDGTLREITIKPKLQ